MRTLLITDDHEGVLHTLDYAFGLRGHRTLLAKSGRAAMEIAQVESLDAALVDLHMPGMDGLAVCRALREHAVARGADFPIWIMTAAGTPALAAKAIEAGAVCVLRKPFDLDEVLAALDEFRNGTKAIPALAPREPSANEMKDSNFDPPPKGSIAVPAR